MKQRKTKTHAIQYFKENKAAFFTYLILRILVVVCMVIQIFSRNYYNVFLCVLTLILFMIPVFVERRLNIKLPSALEITILLFIFAAEILGEINAYYIHFPHWDTMLHTINGFLMAAIGFSMIDILNQNPRVHFNMSPIFVAFVAFCFSMTIGVLWEFFEYSMDAFFLMDMQKDTLHHALSSTALNPNNANTAVVISQIQKTVVTGTVNGEQTEVLINGGYLDLGITDTIHDLIVNCIGATAFSFFGFIYIKTRGKGRVVKNFIPQLKGE